MIAVRRCTLRCHECLETSKCSLLSSSFQFLLDRPLDCQGFSSNPQSPPWMPCTRIEVCQLQSLSLWFLHDRFLLGLQVLVLPLFWCPPLGPEVHLFPYRSLRMIAVGRCTLRCYECLETSTYSLPSLSDQFPPNKPLDCPAASSSHHFRFGTWGFQTAGDW